MDFHLYCMYSFNFLINILEEDRAHYCDVLKYVGVMNSKHPALSASVSSATLLHGRARTVKVMNEPEEAGARRAPSTLITTFISFTAPTCKFSGTIRRLHFHCDSYLHTASSSVTPARGVSHICFQSELSLKSSPEASVINV